MDQYAATFLVFLLITIAVALKWGHRARIMGVTLLSCSWILVMLAKPIGIDAPIFVFATIDFINAILFCIIAGLYDRRWALWVGAFHIGMLMTHLSYIWLPYYTQFVYLSILAAFSYASLFAIMIPPIWERRPGHVPRDADYLGFLHLGYWHVMFGNNRHDRDKS